MRRRPMSTFTTDRAALTQLVDLENDLTEAELADLQGGFWGLVVKWVVKKVFKAVTYYEIGHAIVGEEEEG
jgi:hypothetical protein